jgi:serine/threonine protein kinase
MQAACLYGNQLAVGCGCRELVSGLDHLHSNLIMHGDLKPDNLLLSAEGQLKISDFGSAAVLVSSAQHDVQPCQHQLL